MPEAHVSLDIKIEDIQQAALILKAFTGTLNAVFPGSNAHYTIGRRVIGTNTESSPETPGSGSPSGGV